MTKPEKEILIDAFRSLRLSADQGIALVRVGTPSQLLALSEEMRRLVNQLAATIATHVVQGQTHGR